MAEEKKEKKSSFVPASAKATAGEKAIVDKPTFAKAMVDKPADKEKAEVPKKFKSLVSEIEKLSVLDLAELVKVLEKKFGVSAAAPIAVQVAQSGAALENSEEKTEFDVELKESGPNKIAVIKLVRELTGKGLKESKDLVDAAPKVVKEKVKKEEGEELKKKFEEAGAKVELK